MTLRLPPDGQDRLQQFFRDHTGDPSLCVPPLAISAGAAARLLTRVLGIAAITLGRRVLVAPALVSRDEQGALFLPAGLLVHEAAHVLQFASEGAFRFLARYVRDYLALLRAARRLDAAGRRAAYRAIPAERAARAAAAAYRAWSHAHAAPGDRFSVRVRA
jgi:hypothetical protein